MIQLPLHPPAWGKEENLYALRVMASGGLLAGDAREDLRTQIENRYAGRKAVLTSFGRGAIELALRDSGVEKGDEVILPSICCASVMLPILKIGAIPVFADVDDAAQISVDSVAALIGAKSKAVLAPHLFGFACDIAGLEKLAGDRGIVLIDDAAQSFGLYVDGRPLGSFGTHGILAFGIAKPISAWHGGVWLAPVDGERGVGAASSRFGEAKGLSYFAPARVWRSWWPIEAPLFAGLRSDEMDTSYPVSSLGRAASYLALRMLMKEKSLQRARELRARFLSERLTGVDEIGPLGSDRPTVWTKWVGIISEGETISPSLASIRNSWERFLGNLRSEGIEIAPPYLPLHLQCIEKGIQFRRGDLPRTESDWWRLLALPVEPTLATERLGYMAERIPLALRNSGLLDLK